MAQSVAAMASLCAAPSTALPRAGTISQARRHTERAPFSFHIRASTNPSSSSSSSSSAASHPLARSLTAAAAAALVLLPTASLVLSEPALGETGCLLSAPLPPSLLIPSPAVAALSERERYEQLDNNFMQSPILKQLLKQSEENRAKNRQEIEDKYCLRGAEWGVGDCAVGEEMSADEKKDYLEALREIVGKQAAENQAERQAAEE